MKICLIRPPRFMNKTAVTMNPSPPLGLAFIAGALKNQGHQLSVIDAIAESPEQYNPATFPLNISVPLPEDGELVTNGLSTEEIIERIPAGVEVIGFSCMFTNNWLSDRHVMDAVGAVFPNVPVIAGGESITAFPEFWIKQTKRLDICVLGEGEETIVELTKAIENNADLSTVTGIAYRNADKVTVTPRRQRIRQIEEIPLPAWGFFPVDNYAKYKINWGVTDRKSLPLLATRGCPYDCTFCSSPQMWGRKYSMRSPQHVADEMEALIDNFGVTNFDFYDLTAIIKRDWIIEFAGEIQKRGLDITWQIPAGTRSEAIDSEVAHSLYVSGCRNITYAPESGSEKMLALIHKKVVLKNMLRSINFSSTEGMYICINAILGLPGETHSDVWRTFKFLIQCSFAGANDLGLSIFQPYPGSELFRKLVAEGKLDLTTDDFFIEQIFTDTIGREKLYNTLIPENWYHIYEVLGILIFYGSNYLFRPVRFVRTARNVLLRTYKSRAERALGELIRRRILYSPKSIGA